MNLQWIASSVILCPLDTVCHFVMTTAVRFSIILVLQMGLRKSKNMNKTCYWSSAGNDIKSKSVGHWNTRSFFSCWAPSLLVGPRVSEYAEFYAYEWGRLDIRSWLYVNCSKDALTFFWAGDDNMMEGKFWEDEPPMPLCKMDHGKSC